MGPDTLWLICAVIVVGVCIAVKWAFDDWIWPRLRPAWHRLLDRYGHNDYTKLTRDDGTDEWVSNEQLAVLYAMACIGAPAKASQIGDKVGEMGGSMKPGNIYPRLRELKEFNLVSSSKGWVEIAPEDNLDPGPRGYPVKLWHLNVKLPRRAVQIAQANATKTPVVEGV